MTVLYVNCPICLAPIDTGLEIDGERPDSVKDLCLWVNCDECSASGEVSVHEWFYEIGGERNDAVTGLRRPRRAS